MTAVAGEKILVMAATNRPHELDDAALRRFEKRIFIPLPGDQVHMYTIPSSLRLHVVRLTISPPQARKGVLHKLLTKHHNNLSDKDLNQLALAMAGYSFSDITALAKDAALGPIRGAYTCTVYMCWEV